MSGYLGIDVAKHELVVAREGVAGCTTYANTAAGHAALCAALRAEASAPAV
jgi:hypothetical protein